MRCLSDLVVKANGAPGRWVLDEPLIWELDNTSILEVPAGFKTDLASIPPPFRNILNVNGRSRRAAVLHDYLYKTKEKPRAKCDLLFRQGLIAEGMSRLGAYTYWLGVRAGGWVYY